MKNNIFIIAVLAVALVVMSVLQIRSCGKNSVSHCDNCDSVTLMLNEYIARDSMKSALLASYDEHLSKFGNIQDSIAMFKRAIDSLKMIIRQRGKASGAQSDELKKYLDMMKGLIAQNKELAADMQASGIKNPSMESLIKLMYSNVESNQNELRETQQEVSNMKVEVKELAAKVEQLKEENEVLTKAVAVEKEANKRIRGSVKVMQPKERKAKKIQSLNLSFVLEANMQAEQGKIPVYFRILDPNGKVLEPTGEFMYQGSSIAYTLKSFINYTGKSARSQIEWNKSRIVLEPGTYTVDIFIDDTKGISDTFTLEK